MLQPMIETSKKRYTCQDAEMTVLPKTQEGQGLMLAALFLIAGNIAYFYFGSLVLGLAFLSGMIYSLGFLQGYQRILGKRQKAPMAG
jgi:hypothetical protein